MTRSHPLTKATQAQLRARLTKHLPAVEPLIAELGQIVVACRAGTVDAYALKHFPLDKSLAKAEARFYAFVAESQRFWKAYHHHLMRPGPTAEFARRLLLGRLDPVAQAAGMRLEDTVSLF